MMTGDDMLQECLKPCHPTETLDEGNTLSMPALHYEWKQNSGAFNLRSVFGQPSSSEKSIEEKSNHRPAPYIWLGRQSFASQDLTRRHVKFDGRTYFGGRLMLLWHRKNSRKPIHLREHCADTYFRVFATSPEAMSTALASLLALVSPTDCTDIGSRGGSLDPDRSWFNSETGLEHLVVLSRDHGIRLHWTGWTIPFDQSALLSHVTDVSLTYCYFEDESAFVDGVLAREANGRPGIRLEFRHGLALKSLVQLSRLLCAAQDSNQSCVEAISLDQVQNLGDEICGLLALAKCALSLDNTVLPDRGRSLISSIREGTGPRHISLVSQGVNIFRVLSVWGTLIAALGNSNHLVSLKVCFAEGFYEQEQLEKLPDILVGHQKLEELHIESDAISPKVFERCVAAIASLPVIRKVTLKGACRVHEMLPESWNDYILDGPNTGRFRSLAQHVANMLETKETMEEFVTDRTILDDKVHSNKIAACLQRNRYRTKFSRLKSSHPHSRLSLLQPAICKVAKHATLLYQLLKSQQDVLTQNLP